MDDFDNRADAIIRILETSQQTSPRQRNFGASSLPFFAYAHLREYLNFMTKNGLVEYLGKEMAYVTTQKGTEFLKSYKHLCLLLGMI